MISLYRPGASLLHRLPAALKIVVFTALALAIGILGVTPVAVGIALLVVTALYLLVGAGLGELVAQVLVARWIIVVMVVTQLLFLPLTTAAVNTSRVVIVILLAALLTITTRVSDMLTTLERALKPLKRVGVSPASVSLVFSIAVTAIPTIVRFAGEIREAQRARRVVVRPHDVVVPVLVMSLKYADDLADAMLARGVE